MIIVSVLEAWLIDNYLGEEDELLETFKNCASAAAILGGLLSFVLVFRTNVFYARWWEGRCLWGTLIFSCIHLSQQGCAWIANENLRRRLVNLTIVFAWASKAQLRDDFLQNATEEGPSLVKRGLLQQEELGIIAKTNGWQPYYCLDAIRHVIYEARQVEDGSRLAPDGSRAAGVMAFEDSIKYMALAIGGSTRVKSTGLPASYDEFLDVVTTIFFIIAPLAWTPSMKWGTPVLVTMVYLVVRGIRVLGRHLEEPFGLDPTDHPLTKFCSVIELQCLCVLKRDEEIFEFSKRAAQQSASSSDPTAEITDARERLLDRQTATADSTRQLLSKDF
jgi:putative membrane protein